MICSRRSRATLRDSIARRKRRCSPDEDVVVASPLHVMPRLFETRTQRQRLQSEPSTHGPPAAIISLGIQRMEVSHSRGACGLTGEAQVQRCEAGMTPISEHWSHDRFGSGSTKLKVSTMSPVYSSKADIRAAMDLCRFGPKAAMPLPAFATVM